MISIISNGTVGERMLKQLKSIRETCKKNGIILNVSISLDGINEVHDIIRGKTGCFNQAATTCVEINNNKVKYCDKFGIAATVTQQNAFYMTELDSWAKINCIPISYNIATKNLRLENEDKVNNFLVFECQKTLQAAIEFFYGQFIETKSKHYYAIYYYLTNKHRIALCNYRQNGITLTPDSNISYCAPRSELIGSALQDSSYNIFKNNLRYRSEMCNKNCDECGQYSVALSLKGTILYNKEVLKLLINPFKFNVGKGKK